VDHGHFVGYIAKLAPKKMNTGPHYKLGVLTFSQHIFSFLAIGFYDLIKKKKPQFFSCRNVHTTGKK
jgi:hypothetical protein